MFTAFEGNLTTDPELKTFEDGNASARFRLIYNPTSTDRRTGEIVKGTPVAMSCVARDPLARNIAAGAKKGDRLVVWGEPKTREYTDKDGNRRTVDYLAVDAAGDSYRFRKAEPAPAETPAAATADTVADTGWPEAAAPGSGSAG